MASLLYDLHSHSVNSDGPLSLLSLANLARRSGLAGFAITDHDVLPNPADLTYCQGTMGVEVLAGVELSVRFGERSLHLLAYSFDLADAGMRELCQQLQQHRQQRMQFLVEGLEQRFQVRLPEPRRRFLLQLKVPGRLHLARELIRAKFVTSQRQAFERYLGELRWPTELLAGPITLSAAVDTIHAAGGVAVLAHPPSTMLISDWQQLVADGVDGIEHRFPRAAKNHQRFLDLRLEEYGLVGTAGSDYHGDDPRQYLGAHTVSETTLEQLRERARRYQRKTTVND